MARNGIGYWLPVFLLAVIPIGFSSLGLWIWNEPILWLQMHPEQGIWYFSLCTILTMSFALTPTTFIAALAGFLFGWPGLGGLLLSYPLAAILGRGLGLVWFQKWGQLPLFQQERYVSFRRRLEERPFWVLVMARLSPVLPFAMTNVLLGQLRLSWPIYLLATVVGMLPRTLLSFFAGINIADIWDYWQSPSLDSSGQIWLAILFLISTLGLSLILRKALAASRT